MRGVVSHAVVKRTRIPAIALLLLAAAILLPISASAYVSIGPVTDRTWFWQNPLPQGNDLRSTSWADANTGWAVGVTGTAVKTTDGGVSWTAEDPGTTRDLTGVSFVDASRGWVCGASGTVLHSADGGATWAAQTAPTVPPGRNLRAISFFDANVGVAVGDLGTATSSIVYTNNGGVSWHSAACTATVGLTSVQMVSSTVGWAVGGAGVVLRTTDGGATWTSRPSPTTAGLAAISFAPGGVVGYFVGNAVLPDWTIYKTADSGATWTAVSGLGATGAINLTGVCCLDANNAVAVGTNGQIRHTTDGGATWLNQSANNMQANALRDVKMIDASNIRVIGDFGATFYTRSGGNFWSTAMLGNTATYYAASFADANHGWVSGSNGTIMRTTDAGRNWDTQQSGITNWRGISFSDLSNGWVVGDGGQIARTSDGANWSKQNSQTTNQLNGVWFVNSTTGVAVGNAGTIVKTTNGGVTWIAKPSGTASSLNAVWFFDANTGFAVGTGGVIRKTTNGGETWAATNSGTTQALLAVRGVDATHVWAAGNNGTMIKTTDSGATAWSALASGAGTNPIRTIFFADPSNGWFGSNYGIVRKTTDGGATWVSQNAGMPTSSLDPATGVWACWFADAYTGFIFGDSGTVRRTLDGGASWASLQYGTMASLNAIGFADSLNGWISGSGGFMTHTSDGGQTWAAQKTGSNSALNGISVLDTQTVWAVGDAGTIRRTNNGGLTWIGQPSGVSVSLKSISAVDSNHAVVSGIGTIKYTTDGGSTWASGSVPTTQSLNSVWMADASNGWAVGTRVAGNNVVFHTTDGGATWTQQATPANANLWVVYFRTATTGYVGGDSGVILKTTNGGATWIRQSTPTALPFYGIRFADTNNGLAVGGGGVIARTSDGGATWTLPSSGTARTLTGVAYADASRVWISGGQGVILRNTDLTAPTTTLAATPTPNGANGWYKTDPLISLWSSTSGTTYYGWASSAGPFLPYTGSFLSLEGTRTLYYYSVDTSSNAETVKSATFDVDFTPPTASLAVTATTIATSTAQIQWAASADAISGVDHYDVYVNDAFAVSSTGLSATLAGLTSGAVYSVAVNAVDLAGNVSATSAPAIFRTTGAVPAALTTVLGSTPTSPDGADGWYVTTPTVTLAALPMGAPSDIKFSWISPSGPYGDYSATMTAPAGASTLYFSAHDPLGIRSDEATRQAAFKLDTGVPAAPSVTASATGYASIDLSWPPVLPTVSGIGGYDVYVDGSYVTSTTAAFVDVVGLAPNSTHTFAVYARSAAGATSSATLVSGTTLIAPLPAPPRIVFAKSPSGYFALVDWIPSGDTIGSVSYRVWRSSDGVNFSAVATTTGGLYGTTYIDSALTSSKRYWYAISTLDTRGESSPSDTAPAVAPSISTATTGPQRPLGLSAVESSGSIVLSWAVSANPGTLGYKVLRADASLATASVVATVPAPATTFFDLSVTNGQPYYYSIVAFDASSTGNASLELEARGRSISDDPSPHILHRDADCACHSAHTSTSPTKLIRYPGATVDTVCDSCHPPATSLGEFLDPLAKSRHSLAATVSPDAQFTCNTCHKPLKNSDEATANLMLTNSVSPCVAVTDTPAGDAFCYKCHGVGSKLPMGDLSGFENSAHSNVTAPPTGAGIKCDACHESHSSRNEHLNRYSGYMMCVQCHNSSQSDPNAPDIWSRLTQNSDSNAKHPLLPQDQTNGARMTCQNCHNTHSSSATYPLVDPHNPGPSGAWTTPLSDQKAFCFTCHNGAALPTSKETTPWASAVLASGAATTVANIKDAYQVNVHGLGQRSDSASTTAFLRPDMGYQYGDVLECRSCHDPHGTANNFALQQTIKSSDGLKSVGGIAVAPAPGGGYDTRFFCSTCHLWDSATHDSMANTSTVSFPMNCTACHRHIRNGSPSANL